AAGGTLWSSSCMVMVICPYSDQGNGAIAGNAAWTHTSNITVGGKEDHRKRGSGLLDTGLCSTILWVECS
ncbi:MAG: hypothetical protein ACYTAS_06800, partial [Planctomycetota bacterium]